jgi:hypothetical protein
MSPVARQPRQPATPAGAATEPFAIARSCNCLHCRCRPHYTSITATLALVIAILALVLALCEVGGGQRHHDYGHYNQQGPIMLTPYQSGGYATPGGVTATSGLPAAQGTGAATSSGSGTALFGNGSGASSSSSTR